METNNVHAAVHPLEQRQRIHYFVHYYLGATIRQSIRSPSPSVRCTSLTQSTRRPSARFDPNSNHQHSICLDLSTDIASIQPTNARRVTDTARRRRRRHAPHNSCSAALLLAPRYCCWTHRTTTAAAHQQPPVIISTTAHPAPGIHKRRQPGTNGIGEHCGQYGLPQSPRR